LLVQLEIEYTDGSHDSVLSDESWKAKPSPIIESEIYNGENYDARLEPAGWDRARSPTRAGERSQPRPRPRLPGGAGFPAHPHQRNPQAQGVTNPTPGVYVFDLGQNMVGWARLHVSEKPEPRCACASEKSSPNGELYTENLRTAEATDTYILRGKGSESFEPHFTFHGFRYVELTGYRGRPHRTRLKALCFTRRRCSPFNSAQEVPS
jgi:alpha-L-rhamnosidase